MAKLPTHVLLETGYRGHSVAAVTGPLGALCIDAPVYPSETDDWLNRLQERGAHAIPYAVQMDSSPDRSLGMAHLSVVAFSSPLAVIASQPTAESLRASLSGLRESPSLPAWEAQAFASELNTVQWIRPQVTFSQELSLHWGETTVHILRVPSVTPGSCWIYLVKDRFLFVGDSVASRVPPYLGEANFEAWLEALSRLRRPPFRECRLFCSRSGWVSPQDLARFTAFIRGAQRRYLALAAKKKADVAKELSRAAVSLVAAFGVSADRRAFAQARTRLGLLALWEREHGPLADKPQTF